jgi:hypothetical protein
MMFSHVFLPFPLFSSQVGMRTGDYSRSHRRGALNQELMTC